jgi:hypothetical protein
MKRPCVFLPCFAIMKKFCCYILKFVI